MSSILDELKNKYPNEEGVQKANNIAEGVAAMPTGGSGCGMLVVAIDWDETLQTSVLDKTWQEINNAFPSVAIIDSESGQQAYIVTEVGYDDRGGGYYVRCFHVSNDQLVFERYTSASEDGVLALATT